MRLLIDLNIILDVLQNRKPFVRDSSLVWKLCETGQVDGFVPALFFPNLVYIMRRELSANDVESIIKSLALIFNVTELKQSDLLRGAELGWKDFEDAVQSAIAERIGADYIVTRNTKDFSKSQVPAISPSKFLKLFKESNK